MQSLKIKAIRFVGSYPEKGKRRGELTGRFLAEYFAPGESRDFSWCRIVKYRNGSYRRVFAEGNAAKSPAKDGSIVIQVYAEGLPTLELACRDPACAAVRRTGPRLVLVPSCP